MEEIKWFIRDSFYIDAHYSIKNLGFKYQMKLILAVDMLKEIL